MESGNWMPRHSEQWLNSKTASTMVVDPGKDGWSVKNLQRQASVYYIAHSIVNAGLGYWYRSVSAIGKGWVAMGQRLYLKQGWVQKVPIHVGTSQWKLFSYDVHSTVLMGILQLRWAPCIFLPRTKSCCNISGWVEDQTVSCNPFPLSQYCPFINMWTGNLLISMGPSEFSW